jgi:hypothetical protein
MPSTRDYRRPSTRCGDGFALSSRTATALAFGSIERLPPDDKIRAAALIATLPAGTKPHQQKILPDFPTSCEKSSAVSSRRGRALRAGD